MHGHYSDRRLFKTNIADVVSGSVQHSPLISSAPRHWSQRSCTVVGIICHRKKVPTVARICDEVWVTVLKRAVVPPALPPSLDSILKKLFVVPLNSCTTLFGMIFIHFLSSTNWGVRWIFNGGSLRTYFRDAFSIGLCQSIERNRQHSKALLSAGVQVRSKVI